MGVAPYVKMGNRKSKVSKRGKALLFISPSFAKQSQLLAVITPCDYNNEGNERICQDKG